MREKLTKSDVEKIREEIEHRKLVERKEFQPNGCIRSATVK